MFCLPLNCKIVEGLAPSTTDGAARTSAWVSLQNCNMAFIVAHILQGASTSVVLTPEQATDISGDGAKAIEYANIWSDEDVATSDLLVRQTEAANYTTAANIKHKIVVFQVDPEHFDNANGFNHLGITTGGASASNIVEVMFYLAERYPSDQPPVNV